MANNIDIIYHTKALGMQQTSLVERGFQGQFQQLGTGAQKIGSLPSKRLTVTGERVSITAKDARIAVNKYITDGNNRAGRLFSRALANPEFRTMMETPERLAISAMMADAAAGKVHAWRHYTKMAANYVEQHAGGRLEMRLKQNFSKLVE